MQDEEAQWARIAEISALLEQLQAELNLLVNDSRAALSVGDAQLAIAFVSQVCAVNHQITALVAEWSALQRDYHRERSDS